MVFANEQRLPFIMEQFTQNVSQIVIMLGLIAFVFPYFLVACVPICIFFFSLVRYFRPAQRHMKRLDNTTRSPIFSHLSASLQGLSTIAAYGKQDQFREQFYDHVEVNSKSG